MHRQIAASSTFLSTPVIPAALAFALEAHRADQLDAADTLYREALATSPGHPRALHYFGVLHHQRGDHATALTYLDLSLEIDPMNAECWSDRGIVVIGLGEHELALRCFRVALDLDPSAADTHNHVGVALQAQGRVDEAIYHYREALRLDATHADAHVNLGSALDQLDRFDDADEHYRAALALSAHTSTVRVKVDRTTDPVSHVQTAIGPLRRVTGAHGGFGMRAC